MAAEERINANEIERQAGRLQEQVDKFQRTANDIMESLSGVADIVESEDSNLATTLRKMRDVFEQMKVQTSEKYGDLANVMNTWAITTKQAESQTSDNLSGIDFK